MMETIEHIIKHPQKRLHETPLLFQHGAYHGAWCWDLWMDYFASMGYEVHAISLPGHGKSSMNKAHINFYTLKNYVDTLAGEVEKISPKPVVVGHSMGGAILQRYLESHQLPAVVLLASLPSAGMLPATVRKLSQHPMVVLRTIFLMNMYESVKTPELARELFLNPDTEVDVTAFYKQLVWESFGAQRLMFPFKKINAEKSPVLVIAAEKDAFFTLEEERKTAEKYGAKFVIIKGQPHNLMMESAWKETADVVAGWLRELNLP